MSIGVIFGRDGGTQWVDGEPEISLGETATGKLERRASLVASGEPWANVLAGACDGLGVPRPSWFTSNDCAPRVLGYARALLVANRYGHGRACEILGEDLAALLRWTGNERTEGAPQHDHARAFAKGYVIARERPPVAGDYPPEGHADHGSQPFLLAMGMGAAYAGASVPFWEAVYRWRGIERPRFSSSMTPEFIAKIDGETGCLTYHEIQDHGLDLVATDDLDAPLYLGACEGRAALEREEGSWTTLSTEAQDKVLALLDGAWISAATAPFDAAARALRHLAGRTEET